MRQNDSDGGGDGFWDLSSKRHCPNETYGPKYHDVSSDNPSGGPHVSFHCIILS